MTTQLPNLARSLFDGANYATIATIEPDGRPQLSVVWVRRDGDDVLVSTIVGRRKHTNLVRDPRATILVFPNDDANVYAEVRGSVTLAEDGGPELIDELARKYNGDARFTGDDGTSNVRVVVRLRPEKVVIRE
jgi:PPOX class probable F420-dependent enzyme